MFPRKEVVRVAITGAAGQIGYSLVPLIARGAMLENQKVELRLLDIEEAMKGLIALQMELQDCAFPLVAGVIPTFDAKLAFEGCDIAIMCGAFPRKEGMERKDLLAKNAKIFSDHGALLAMVAEPHCRVLVVGNPANTNALILSHSAKAKLDPLNISALTRLDHNRATFQTENHLRLPPGTVKNMIIWGNHSGTQVPDAFNATANGGAVASLIPEGDNFFTSDFMTVVQQRGAAVIKQRGLSSAFSAAKAIVDHVHDWILGTKPGEFVSMGVLSDNNPYGVPSNLIFSFPVVCEGGKWKHATGVAVHAKIREKLTTTTEELLQEREQAGL